MMYVNKHRTVSQRKLLKSSLLRAEHEAVANFSTTFHFLHIEDLLQANLREKHSLCVCEEAYFSELYKRLELRGCYQCRKRAGVYVHR